jgi:predicted acylesterase/phospholipase RssA
MPYNVELMSIGDDVYPLLQRSANALNGVQDKFRFELTSPFDRRRGIEFQRSRYVTSEIWDFLRDQRTTFGGNRPYIIAFVNKPLASPKLSNIFGSHEAHEGLAAVTLFGAARYVKEDSRYCCYYLVRYSLSFVNPLIKAHRDEERKSCYFHAKDFKPELRLSMDSGNICDRCQGQLDNPPKDSVAHQLSVEEREALRQMRQFVSGDLPHALVMKGGGVKGLAFAGALLELEKFFWFDRHVGASAGAIAAVLLAASYTPAELRDLLLEKNFRDFMDAPGWRTPINLVLRQGCYPGEAFRLWIADLLTRKNPQLSRNRMTDLEGALIYASTWGAGTIRFDSDGERKETAADFAVRCSMSIPVFFTPTQIDGRRVFDGGLRNNFPLARFLSEHPRSNYIALYLGKPDHRSTRWLCSELLDIFIEGEERETVDKNRRNVVVIDTYPVGTVDFRLSSEEKKFLLQVGKAAALKFLQDRQLDDGPSALEVEDAWREAEASRTLVRTHRARKRRRRFLWGGFFITVVAAMYLLGLFSIVARELKLFL